jgi:peroxidase
MQGARQQINLLTAFIDGSVVYGSDAERAGAIRRNASGELLTSHSGLSLPYNVPGLPNGGGTQNTSFLAGDPRVNEQIGLISIHTLFVREHNRLAALILEHYPSATDEQVYQLARKIVGAEIQKVTYTEFLPILLGPMAPNLAAYAGYNTSYDPSIFVEFSTAIYRVGHTMLSPQLQLSLDGKTVSSQKSLRDSFFKPELFLNNPYLTDMILGGLMLQDAQKVDTKIIDDVRNFLFMAPTESGCLDLIALNIQRGRDHGM